VLTRTNGLISTIFGASLINHRLGRRYNTWRCALAVFLLPAFSAAQLGAGELLCPPWHNSAPEAIIPTEIPAPLTQILRYHKGSGLLANFAEEKKVLILQRPLRSTGQVIFLPQKGLYRQLVTPFQQELLITTIAVHQRDDRGRVETMSLDKLPLAKALVEGFLTVFSGSWESIHSHFQVYFFSADLQWKLGLLPKHTMMSQIVSCIILEGESHQMHSLWVHETNGDITHDRFTDSHLLAPEQWGAYQRYFEWGH
jgi:Outer membrane lipoprotein carrier protein LolA-like